ncbi:MAG: hypothetical protein ACOC9O_00770, partial [Myxococcota bacterium]
MTDHPPSPRRRTFALLALLVLMGSCGVAKGTQNVGSRPPGADFATAAESVEMAEVEEELARFSPPLRRPLAAANIVVSALLLIAAWTVASGRPSRLWWVTQAALANAVWTGLDAGTQVAGLFAAQDELVPLLERALAEAGSATTEVPAWMQDGHTVLYGTAAILIGHALL